MSEDKRYFETEKHVKLYVEARPTVPASLVTAIKQYLLETRTDKKESLVAVDIACGSGQGTQALAKQFDRVLGTDISPGQIREAQKLIKDDNIVFQVGTAEYIDATDGSVDLVFCNMAVHWFNRDKFFAEVRRVLRPGGVLAISAFSGDGIETPLNIDSRQKEQYMAACKKFNVGIRAYFDPAIELYMRRYVDIHPLPGFKDPQYRTDLYGRRSTPVRTQLENLKTTSAFNTLLAKDAKQANQLVAELESGLSKAFPNLDTVIDFQYDIILLLGRA